MFDIDSLLHSTFKLSVSSSPKSVSSLSRQFACLGKDETVCCELQPEQDHATQHQGQRPLPHSDQYWINILWIIWQVLSTLCAPTCALYLDYWLSGFPQDLTCSWRIQQRLGPQTCKPGNSPIISLSLSAWHFCVSVGQIFPESHWLRNFKSVIGHWWATLVTVFSASPH